MKRRLAIVIGWISAPLLAAPALAAPTTPPSQAVLRWNNGETVGGELLEASPSDVTWKTPFFEDPLLLRWSALHRIDRHLAAVPTADPFSIILRDGSHLYGSLVSITPTVVSIHSARHGDVSIARSEVLSARRIRGAKLLFAGPEGDAGWEAASAGNRFINPGRAQRASQEIPVLATGPGGALLMPYWNRGAFLKAALPELVDVECRVRSSIRPDFRLELERGPKAGMTIETWDGDLVLTTGAQFKLIRKIADTEREVSFRICWDSKTRKCSVFSPGGELLAEWQPASEIGHPPTRDNTRSIAIQPRFQVVPRNVHQVAGLALLNKGRDLSLEFLRVRGWDGTPPPKVDGKRARIELDDGQILEADVGNASADAIELPDAGEDSEQSIPLSEVDAIVFSADPPRIGECEATFSYADGTLLMGRIASVRDGVATILSSFAKTPLTSRMDGLRQLRLRVPPPADAGAEPPMAELDTITMNGCALHGKLASGGDNWPRWLPVGGVRPAIPAKGLASEIRRAFPANAEIPSVPALFYTGAGDILPGKLQAIDRSGVEFESGLVEATKLSADAIDAIQLHPGSRVSLRGFGDPGWQVIKGNSETVRRVDGALEMAEGTEIGHPAAMQCREISFSIASANYSAFRLRLFCDGLDATKSKSLLCFRTGYQFFSGLEPSEGQFANQMRTRVSLTGPVSVRLMIDDHTVELYVDGNMIQSFPMPASSRAGSGLIIEPTSAWGNEVTPVSLSKFSAISEPGHTWMPNVPEETKTQTLTVPRFLRDDPPRHALLAPNGDVLRGEIEASTASHFGFRSGLENLRVPINRVAAVIWLKKPAPNGAPSAPASPTLKQLDHVLTRFGPFIQGDLKVVISCLKQEAPDLRFKLPKQTEWADNRVYQIQFGGKTVGEALNEICSLLGLRYRIDGEGTVVLEPGPSIRADLAQKVYWLKMGAFPTTGAPREILTAKGISFPPGAGADWEPKAGELEMINTAANQEKLAKLIETDFGGSLGSPTHWLLLANGARLGLVVDSFDKDSVSGHHPVYGRCRAAVSEIYAIRTSLPEPGAAANALKDWRLVYAPEPVLPETGGDTSAALGKMAKTFKLPLLTGGDFDLAQQKGKIVVLDFWATWCGPCVQSLPGLIEAMSAFPADQVKLIGVNQSEPAEQVKRFLETRGWKLTVAMDASQNVARQYGVDGIPHTVIVGPDGKVAWVKTGYSPDGETEAANAVKQLLAPPASAEAPASAEPSAKAPTP